MQRGVFFALMGLLALSATGLRAQTTEFPKTAPPDATPPAVATPVTLRQTLPNGLRVVIRESHTVPTVSIKMGIRAGVINDPLDSPLLSELVFQLVEEGTKKYDKEKRDKAAHSMGGDLAMEYGADYVDVSATCLSQYHNKMLDLMSDMLLNSKFDAEQVAGYQRGMTENIKRRRFPRSGDDKKIYPYEQRFPDRETIKLLSYDRVVEYLSDNWSPNNSILVIAGDINAEAAMKQVKTCFGGWRRGSPKPLPKFAPTVVRPLYYVFIEDEPTAIESKIQMICNVPNLDEQDKIALQVAETILGGTLDSRLFKIIREKYGYVYGINSILQFYAMEAKIAIVTQCRSAVTARCLKQIENEIAKMSKEGPPADELDIAKNYLARKYDLALQSQSDIAEELFQIEFYKRPVDYFRQLRSKINQITSADVLRASKKYVFPDGSALITIVGPKSKIVDKVLKANVGYVLNPDE